MRRGGVRLGLRVLTREARRGRSVATGPWGDGRLEPGQAGPWGREPRRVWQEWDGSPSPAAARGSRGGRGRRRGRRAGARGGRPRRRKRGGAGLSRRTTAEAAPRVRNAPPSDGWPRRAVTNPDVTLTLGALR